MDTSNQGRAAQLEEAMASALAAAVDRVGRRAEQVVMAARLATAVHMSRAAESAATGGQAASTEVPSTVAASAPPADAARLVRPGGLA